MKVQQVLEKVNKKKVGVFFLTLQFAHIFVWKDRLLESKNEEIQDHLEDFQVEYSNSFSQLLLTLRPTKSSKWSLPFFQFFLPPRAALLRILCLGIWQKPHFLGHRTLGASERIWRWRPGGDDLHRGWHGIHAGCQL